MYHIKDTIELLMQQVENSTFTPCILSLEESYGFLSS